MDEEGAAPRERRTRPDRRRPRQQVGWQWVAGGRRRATRRASDSGRVHLDWYPAPLLGVVMVVLALSSLDAGLTLHLLGQGVAVEANPLMSYLLASDVRLFVNLKTALTGSSLVLLVAHADVSLLGVLRIGRCLYVIAVLYALLIGYEFSLAD